MSLDACGGESETLTVRLVKPCCRWTAGGERERTKLLPLGRGQDRIDPRLLLHKQAAGEEVDSEFLAVNMGIVWLRIGYLTLVI